MNVNKITLSLGIVAFIAAFLPMASNDVSFVGVEHMGNLTKLLYFLPLGIIGISCATTRLPFKLLGTGLGMAGAILTPLTVWSGIRQAELMAGMFGGLATKALGMTAGATLPGYGGIIAGLSYIGVVIMALRHHDAAATKN
ncbi:hypothetical protein [Pseudodesulfovibrio sp.]|uniref:hypothetical protein n=1 Tax=Pseudodesulfovibrio sp. TaxID=2035812 RepID=UPI002621AD3E|nr:hypothetical protein [Pseudodesulfovibrio sp.]MDD3311453.1 hypothetical protein [Pseudodesulfovibrio sp.]